MKQVALILLVDVPWRKWHLIKHQIGGAGYQPAPFHI